MPPLPRIRQPGVKSWHLQTSFRFAADIDPAALFESDGLKHHAVLIKRQFPEACHVKHIGGRGAMIGQGELNKTRREPLFWINHTLAMLRANINRLVRRTWCTTRIPERLVAHLWLYIRYHNQEIRKALSKKALHNEETGLSISRVYTLMKITAFGDSSILAHRLQGNRTPCKNTIDMHCLAADGVRQSHYRHIINP